MPPMIGLSGIYTVVKRSMVQSAIALIVVCLAQAGASADARQADEDGPVLTVSGTVSSRDWVDSKLTIRMNGYGSRGSDEMTFSVPRDASITSGSAQLSLSDIDQGDTVTVRYCSRSQAGFWAQSIEDSNQLNHQGA